MRLGLKIPSSKPRLLANGKRGLQNPYFDLKKWFAKSKLPCLSAVSLGQSFAL